MTTDTKLALCWLSLTRFNELHLSAAGLLDTRDED